MINYYEKENKVNAEFKMIRNIYGFDSFEGLQETDKDI